MREVITVQVGQCGNQIGVKFWEGICQEHCVNPMGCFEGDSYQFMGIPTHFSETAGRNYVPRALLVDLDPMTLDSCRCSPYGQIYRPDNFIFGRSGAQNNWAVGHNTEGVDVADYALEALRREIEDCESLSGFSMIHALGGGCGSGLGCLILEGILDEYPKKITTSYCVVPSNNVSETTVEPYNTVLSYPALRKCCHRNVLFDNDAMYRICRNVLRLDLPSFGDINEVVARVLVGMTCCMRFPGTRNVSLRKRCCTMCPNPDAKQRCTMCINPDAKPFRTMCPYPDAKQRCTMCCNPDATPFRTMCPYLNAKQRCTMFSNPDATQFRTMCSNPDAKQRCNMCADPEAKQRCTMCCNSDATPFRTMCLNPEDTPFHTMCCNPDAKKRCTVCLNPDANQCWPFRTMCSNPDANQCCTMCPRPDANQCCTMCACPDPKRCCKQCCTMRPYPDAKQCCTKCPYSDAKQCYKQCCTMCPYPDAKQFCTMCEYPDAHFFIPGWAPLNSRGVQAYRTFSLEDTIHQIFRRDTWMASVNAMKGKFITTETILRGHHSELLLEDLFDELQRNNKSHFVPWLDNHCSYGICCTAPVGMKIGTTFLANHTCITQNWRKVRDSFQKMFNVKAFAHWYCGEGLEDDDFIAAEASLTGLIDKYEFLERLPESADCVTEMGEEEEGEEPGCNSDPCLDQITNCDLDSISSSGELGPFCVDRRQSKKICRRYKNPYCRCTLPKRLR